MSKDLQDLPGKEGLMITVVYPPGASDPIHRHKAHAFVYTLEGSIVMHVKGAKEVTLTPGQTFYESRCRVAFFRRGFSEQKCLAARSGLELTTHWLTADRLESAQVLALGEVSETLQKARALDETHRTTRFARRSAE
jgi:hypothetical protein